MSGPESSLRGWLSDLFFPTLAEGDVEKLLRRLGTRGTVAVPGLGKASGVDDQRALLLRLRAWMTERNAQYDRLSFFTGLDRDITEGALVIGAEGERRSHAVAVVAERRKGRELDIRVYAPRGVFEGPPIEAPTGSPHAIGLAGDIAAALTSGDVAAFAACFEADGELTFASATGARRGTGEFESGFQTLSAAKPEVAGFAEEGQVTALELRTAGAPLLLTLHRGDSSLFRYGRVYGALSQ
ncbi:MAG: hypothetical protein HOO96_38170 [Polyangiaceae bacterium]|nr:hypothetical protein [Polyangiaceae bacterium]